MANLKHGDARRVNRTASEYITWQGMIQRCNNPNSGSYENYGGRGIKVCHEWNNYSKFLADMGRKPTYKHQIDRINNDGNYEPSNCRWATASEQQSNKRGTVLLSCGGQSKTLTQWASGIKSKDSKSMLWRRINKLGWSLKRALETPALRCGRQRLSESQVLEIRRRYTPHDCHSVALAKEFGVTTSCIYAILHRKSWKHI